MNDQLALQFPSAAAPLQPDPEAERLVNYLHQNPGFHTRHQLMEILGLTDRKIRQLAEQSDGFIVSGPGSPGYIHIDHCSLEKFNHIKAAVRSQARAMLARYIKMSKRGHQIIK